MNCKETEQLMTEYLNGTLTEENKASVDIHLEKCQMCSALVHELSYSDNIINEEKKMKSNPFLATRVMASIDNLEMPSVNLPESVWKKALQPAIITALIIIGIFIGYKMGGLYTSGNHQQLVNESAYINDIEMESLNYISQNN
jgi:predicted anti-sigma-YlaC factor YlaD